MSPLCLSACVVWTGHVGAEDSVGLFVLVVELDEDISPIFLVLYETICLYSSDPIKDMKLQMASDNRSADMSGTAIYIGR